MHLIKSQSTIFELRQGLGYRSMSGTVPSLVCYLLVGLFSYFSMHPSVLFAGSAKAQDQPLVTQEIRYYLPEAGEVFLVWGVNGWTVVPEEIRPAGTTVKNRVMHTPMAREGDTFVAEIRVPSAVTLDYGFLVTKKSTGKAIEPVWEGGQRYYVIATKDGVIEAKATLTLEDARELPSLLDIGLHLLIAICVVLGVMAILKRTPRLPNHGPSVHTYVAIQDCLFLSLVVVLSLILYVWNLGFYSDDWSFLAPLSMSADQSIIGLFQALNEGNLKMRPVQALYWGGLYWLFGPQPLGYHLVNGSVFLLSVLLFSLSLRELGQHRVLTLAVPIVYALLPHYSTDRFWLAVNVANLSMAFYFLSLYSALRGLRASPRHFWSWKLLCILSLLGSTLAYEVALPLFLLNMMLVWYRGRGQFGSIDKSLGQATRTVSHASDLVALVAVIFFKTLTTTRMGNNGLLQELGWIAKRAIAINYGTYDTGLNFKQAIAVNYGDYGLELPRIVVKILRDYPDKAVFLVGGVLGLVILGYLYHVVSKSKAELPCQTSMLKLTAWGLIVFGLGYAIFLTNANVMFTPTGIGNRTAIAAAVGVALSLVGALGWVSAILPLDRFRRHFFCCLVTLLCVSGFLINNTLGSFWIAAYRQEQEILVDIRQRFATLPAGSTLILDGVCPYVGPAIVFESSWDLSGALVMFYRDYTLRADVVTPNLRIEEDGLYTSIYDFVFRYPYDKLFVYHFGRKMRYPLTDAESARLYFQTFNPDHSNGCPRGHEGHGVTVF